MKANWARFLSYIHWHSISARITFFTLLSCLVGGGMLATASVHFLTTELEQELGLQQFSTATVIASQVDYKMQVLVKDLDAIAMQIGQYDLSQTAEMQSSLADNANLPWVFSAGVFVINAQQQLVATSPSQGMQTSLPVQLKQIVPAMLRDGRSIIMDPFYDAQSGSPMIAIAVPIRNAKGQRIAVLAGMMNLHLPHSFDYFSNSRFGKTGYYNLVAPSSRLIVAATDPRRRMERLPAIGINPGIDRFLAGFEGSAQIVNPKGEKVLSSVKRIETSGWLIVVSLPVTEAFSSIANVRDRVLLFCGLISLVIGAILVWVIRRQLAPLSIASAAVISQAKNIDATLEIPVASQDEIGKLVTDFNHLLSMLRERDAALMWSEQRFRAIFDAEPECVKLVDARGQLLDMNAAGLSMLEVDTVEQAKSLGLASFIVQTYRGQFAEFFDQVIHGKAGFLVFELIGLGGTHRWLDSHAIPFKNPVDGQNMMLAVTRDITQQKQAQLALIASEFRWKFAIEGSGDGLWDWNLQDNTVYFSQRWKEMLGFAEHEIDNHLEAWSSRVHPDDLPTVLRDINAHVAGTDPLYKNSHRMLCKDGQWKWILDRGVVVARDEHAQALRMIGTHSDISEQHALQDALQVSLQEKVGLLNEVHHRVKNNLQVITSLLRLESGRSTHHETKTTLNDMQGRIRSMALLHEALYRSGIFASADLGVYLRELANHAFRAHAAGGNIRLLLALDSVTVSMDQATPCGLMVNELISNCLKHAFPEDMEGEIRLTLHAFGAEGQMRLCVSDNGQGMPEDLAARCEMSLGLRLVADLALQMRGQLHTSYHPITEFSVLFTPDLVQQIQADNLPSSFEQQSELV